MRPLVPILLQISQHLHQNNLGTIWHLLFHEIEQSCFQDLCVYPRYGYKNLLLLAVVKMVATYSHCLIVGFDNHTDLSTTNKSNRTQTCSIFIQSIFACLDYFWVRLRINKLKQVLNTIASLGKRSSIY